MTMSTTDLPGHAVVVGFDYGTLSGGAVVLHVEDGQSRLTTVLVGHDFGSPGSIFTVRHRELT